MTCLPEVSPGELGSVCLELALRGHRGGPLDGRGTEAQDGAQASPVLLALGLDAVGDGLLHLFSARQQQVHQVHVWFMQQ